MEKICLYWLASCVSLASLAVDALETKTKGVDGATEHTKTESQGALHAELHSGHAAADAGHHLMRKEAAASWLALSGQEDEAHALAAESQRLNVMLQELARKIEDDKVKEFLSMLKLCAPCRKLERFGELEDGGYVMCTDQLDNTLKAAYSYGINGFDGWGMAVAQLYDIPLHEYDCTNTTKPAACPGCKVQFHAECVSGLPEGTVWSGPYKSLTKQLQDSGNGDAPEGSLLLKIDVEGAEWQAFHNMPIDSLKKFREIVVELHWLGSRENYGTYTLALQKLQQAGFSVAHLHGNNRARWAHLERYQFPDVLEVTYVKMPPGGTCSDGLPYRVAQDRPNGPEFWELPEPTLPGKETLLSESVSWYDPGPKHTIYAAPGKTHSQAVATRGNLLWMIMGIASFWSSQS